MSRSSAPGGQRTLTSAAPSTLPAFVPLAVPRKLADDAAAALRDQILSGGIKLGTHLVEARIAALLNVSRGTVREAFKALAAEGLIQEEPRRGAFVVTLSRADVRDIYGVRAAVEGRAAYLVAERHDETELAELAHAVDAIATAAASGDLAETRRSDLAFHDLLCALSGNSRLHEVFLRHVPVLHALLVYDALGYASQDDVAEQHRPILEAIDAGDAELASRRAIRHCDEACERVAPYFDEPGGE
jgi:GntR family transcriptional regulator of gluconate operon